MLVPGPMAGAVAQHGLEALGSAQSSHYVFQVRKIQGVPKIRGTFLGVLITRTVVFGGLYRGPPICGSYHLGAFEHAGKGFDGESSACCVDRILG